MSVQRGGLDLVMAEHLLDHAEIDARFEQMGGEGQGDEGGSGERTFVPASELAKAIGSGGGQVWTASSFR